MRRFTRRATTVFVASAVAVGGGVAWAAWTASGTGSASAKAGQAVALTTDATVTPGTLLYPGGAGDLKVKVNNANPYPVQINVLNGNGAITADAAHQTLGCVDHKVTLSPTFNIVGWVVPKNGSAEFSLSGVVHMGADSPNGCQGATFTIPVTLVGASNA